MINVKLTTDQAYNIAKQSHDFTWHLINMLENIQNTDTSSMITNRIAVERVVLAQGDNKIQAVKALREHFQIGDLAKLYPDECTYGAPAANTSAIEILSRSNAVEGNFYTSYSDKPGLGDSKRIVERIWKDSTDCPF
jgi:hypothetical protein